MYFQIFGIIFRDLGKYEVIEGEGGVEFDLNIEDVWTIAHYRYTCNSKHKFI